jgi:hypothetical protein
MIKINFHVLSHMSLKEHQGEEVIWQNVSFVFKH